MCSSGALLYVALDRLGREVPILFTACSLAAQQPPGEAVRVDGAASGGEF
jgi:hypothetical protein